jgi:hypothetical protein
VQKLGFEFKIERTGWELAFRQDKQNNYIGSIPIGEKFWVHLRRKRHFDRRKMSIRFYSWSTWVKDWIHIQGITKDVGRKSVTFYSPVGLKPARSWIKIEIDEWRRDHFESGVVVIYLQLRKVVVMKS